MAAVPDAVPRLSAVAGARGSRAAARARCSATGRGCPRGCRRSPFSSRRSTGMRSTSGAFIEREARKAGVPDDVIRAIEVGTRPALTGDDAVVYDFARRSSRTAMCPMPRSTRAVARLGQKTVVELSSHPRLLLDACHRDEHLSGQTRSDRLSCSQILISSLMPFGSSRNTCRKPFGFVMFRWAFTPLRSRLASSSS